MKKEIKICHGFSCSKNFSKYTFQRALNELEIENEEGEETKDGNFSLHKCGCMGLCEKGPNVKITEGEKEEILLKCDPIKISEKIKQLKKR